jgi:hypothetical protein
MALRFELRPSRRIDDELLHELGERVVRAVPHHPVMLYHGRAWVVAACVWVYLVMITNARIEAVLPFFFLLGRGWWLLAKAHLDWFVVTDMRILRIQGVFNVRHAAMSLSRIVDFTMEQPFWGQLMGYGHLIFENAAQDQGLREIRYIGGVAELNKVIQQLVFEAGGGPARHKRVAEGPVEPPEGAVTVPAQSADAATDMDATGEIPRVT